MFKKTILAGSILFFVPACATGTDIKFVQDTNKTDVLKREFKNFARP